MNHHESNNFSLTVTLVIFALFTTFFAVNLNLPASWFITPLFIAILFSLKTKDSFNLHPFFSIFGQIILGIATASSFSFDNFLLMKSYIFPVLICIFFTSFFSLINALLIAKFTNIDFFSSFLGSIPGASASLVAISEDLGANTVAVTVLQYLRLILIAFTVPNFIGFYFPSTINVASLSPHFVSISPDFGFHLSTIKLTWLGIQGRALVDYFMVNFIDKISREIFSLHHWLNVSWQVLLIIFVSFLGIKLAEKINLPSKLFLGSFFGCLILFNLNIFSVHMPPAIVSLGLFLLGLAIGIKFDHQSIGDLIKMVIIEVILVIILIIICLIIGYEFHLLTGVDIVSALLGTTPGGLNVMTATAIELNADVSIVLTMQMMRMFLILCLSPFLARFVMEKTSSLNNSYEVLKK
ncbi:MAG: AbrB family transcriptional regulator [Cyanobacterium sp. T60_A2020_053]|nr:AbrB family transcriptional regulator [Cyanobacterium sp. T60_A2020_053]